MKITYRKYRLAFKRPAGTSRSILLHNDVWYIFIEKDAKIGVGECNPLLGLSIDDRPDYEEKLKYFIQFFSKNGLIDLSLLEQFPSIKFGFECALQDLETGGQKILFPSAFTEGKDSIPINGLLWMGSKDYMLEQLEDKLAQGFTCIKMKIGAINFEDELSVLKTIRANYAADKIEIRVDANGAFKASEARGKLEKLAQFDIHSIEQPIAVGLWKEMKELIKVSPIAIALDEELISLRLTKERARMLEMIRPDYIILKPSLLGGFEDSNEWIAIAEGLGIKWWITSALESNIGLNAIAQFAFTKNIELPQGLGTGALYKNNIASPLRIENAQLNYDPSLKWGDLNNAD
jgi:o-succinylbenzoate synthase